VLRTLEGHFSPVERVAVTVDGKRVFSASRDETLKVWDLEAGQVLRALEGHSGYVSGVAVTADGQRAVSASMDCTVRVWDLKVGRALSTLRCDSPVTSLAVTGRETGRFRLRRQYAEGVEPADRPGAPNARRPF
jgi:WD40 repeat protein